MSKDFIVWLADLKTNKQTNKIILHILHFCGIFTLMNYRPQICNKQITIFASQMSWGSVYYVRHLFLALTLLLNETDLKLNLEIFCIRLGPDNAGFISYFHYFFFNLCRCKDKLKHLESWKMCKFCQNMTYSNYFQLQLKLKFAKLTAHSWWTAKCHNAITYQHLYTLD